MSPGLAILAGVGLLLGLLVGAQWGLARLARRAEGKPAPVLPGPLGERVRGDVILWFHGPGCAPCQRMKPGVLALGDAAVAVDVSTDLPLAQRFGVMATPTTVVIRGGEVRRVHVGPLSPPQLAELAG